MRDPRPHGPLRGLLRALQDLLDSPVRRAVAGPVLVLVWVVTTLVAFIVREVLPTRFFYDGMFIESIAVGQPFTEPDRVFGTTGWLYWALGLTLDPALPTLFGMIVAAVLVAAAYASRSRTTPLAAVLLSAAALALYAVYFAWYTKETFAALAITGTVLLLRSNVHRFWAVAPILAYGAFLRQYWLVVVAMYVGFLIVERMRALRWWRLAFWASGALVAATAGYAIIIGGSVQSIREGVNAFRDASDAASMIPTIAPPGNIVTDALGAIVVVLLLVVPVPLFLTGVPMHAVYALAIMAMWAVVFVTSWSLRSPLPATATPEQARARRTAMSCVYLLVAFLTVLSLFEPDYGSYLRHLSSLVPVMVVLAIAQKRARSIDA